MTHTRKKLLLREDEAEMIEYALDKIAGGFEAAGKEYSDMQIVATRAADKKRWEVAEKVASRAALRRADGRGGRRMMNLKEIFKHYADDLGDGADIRKEAIASIEQAAEYIDEHTLRHHSRLLAIAYLALEAETTQIIDGCCTACGALMDCCEAAEYKFCPMCGRKFRREK